MSPITLIIGLCLLGVSHSSTEFKAYQETYGKIYFGDEEELRRLNIFNENLKIINEHNSKPGTSYKMGINQYSDMTDEEFRTKILGYHPKMSDANPVPVKAGEKIDIDDLPKNVDWREKGAITKVKNQGHCGSCWAFASVEEIESYIKINGGSLYELSTQQLTSCSPNSLNCGGAGGCKGSVPSLAFTYAQLFGLVEESDYPYVSGVTNVTGECTYNANETPPFVKVSGYEKLPTNDMAAVMNHIANVGPLAVAVDATLFRHFSSGVFEGCDFEKNIDINHAVQLVGYGTDDKLGDYWLVRNSWGETFGEKGYIRLKRFSEAKCGTDMTPSHGLACNNDGQSTQHVCGNCGILFDTVYPLKAKLV